MSSLCFGITWHFADYLIEISSAITRCEDKYELSSSHFINTFQEPNNPDELNKKDPFVAYLQTVSNLISDFSFNPLLVAYVISQ